MPKSFRELEVWQLAMKLSLDIYGITAAFPKHEVYGLSSQMRRAAVSIASNIAEGSARGTKKDFRLFVLHSRGSNAELQTQLLLAIELGYCDPTKAQEALLLCQRVGRMLHGLSDYLKKSAKTPLTPAT